MALTAAYKRPPVRKKRTGQHHKHSQHYLKHYWPYLPMLLVVGFGLVLNNLWSSRMAVLGSQTDLTASQLLIDTNSQRHDADEPSLSLNSQLTAAAQAKADDMVARDYWSHDTPSGQTPWSFISSAGYRYRTAGENLAYGFRSSGATLSAWMHSPEHRANILNDSYSQVGFATASSPDYVGQGAKTVIVALYASPGEVVDSAVPAVQSDPGAQVKGASLNAEPVSRLALMTPAQSMLPMVAASLTVIAVVVFVSRHGRFLHRSLARGEVFVMAHPLFDIALVVVATTGFVVTRAGGFVL